MASEEVNEVVVEDGLVFVSLLERISTDIKSSVNKCNTNKYKTKNK